MRRVCLRLVLGVGLAVFAPAASACVNDGELVRSEAEFKSRYQDQQPSSSKSTRWYRKPYLLSVPGAALLVGAFVLARRGRGDE